MELLKLHWGHTAFRSIQEEIITSVLAGNDTLALLPTGGGKSICFQIPALMQPGLCLVISPLIALMKDQVEQLRRRNIPALSIHSGMTFFDVEGVLQNAAFGQYKFLYVSPERLETSLFRSFLPRLNITLVAVDEAHCISQWGYDFRPAYLKIVQLREELGKVPVLALTASATAAVQDDICSKLNFKQSSIFRQSFERPNLSYSAFNADSKLNKLLDILRKVPGSAIVYCNRRKRCKEIAQELVRNNIVADFYHAGLLQEERNKKQESWIKNRTMVMVCTNAFGMGIDKPDVRTVIHMDVPDSLESYYQEAGRAGRDGNRSFAVLLYRERELMDLAHSPEVRYPPVDEIRKIYQALANFLQLPVGAGEGLYFEFHLNDFVRQFELDIFLVMAALKALEQDGHLTFSEQVFIPAKLGFTCDKESLDQFQQAHPEHQELLKTLLRTYHGIFDNVVSISESLLCRLTGMNAEVLRSRFAMLEGFGILKYYPQKETPQVYFNQNRAPAAYLSFNQAAYFERKLQFKKRIDAMLAYVRLQAACRSTFIGNYFGDTNLSRCGVCDNCLQLKNLQLSKEDFLSIQTKILETIPESGIEVKTLIDQLSGIKKEKLWKVLDYLHAEKLLIMHNPGIVSRVHA
ncbi:RecQ family ATP-dependent DNA helicase [Segetibacter sp. 3557_3]|nr:RecQ family ATP-dependent DNA helicase [Segetibacter sp. 3557_3]